VLFGIMSFVLNYIPNVGSLIAMFLPLPVVLLDPQLKSWQKIGAFAGPGAVQGYVGNVLEPTVFGASLNMTPLSILSALVMWSSIWGLPGAILSVPMLGIQKISCGYINHPFANYMLMLIREDPTLDETKAREESVSVTNPILLGSALSN
jgi:predicted PurR-regulated permease PerM